MLNKHQSRFMFALKIAKGLKQLHTNIHMLIHKGVRVRLHTYEELGKQNQVCF